MTHPYTYVLVRTDISLEQQVVQAVHAGLEAGFAFEAPAQSSSVVVCSVDNNEALLDAAQRLERHGIQVQLFFEPDFGIGHSALCTRPILQKKERYVLAKYPLWRAHHAAAAHVG